MSDFEKIGTFELNGKLAAVGMVGDAAAIDFGDGTVKAFPVPVGHVIANLLLHVSAASVSRLSSDNERLRGENEHLREQLQELLTAR